MTIQRQYSLPNCNLLVEGLGDDMALGNLSGNRPVLSILTNVECHLAGFDKPLTGGREFLESLVTAVSAYAQECLSGVRHPIQIGGKPELVTLERLENDRHRLTVHPAASKDVAAIENNGQPMQLELHTVQLFDLVEAVDQLVADTQTLPDLAPTLAPVSRRYIAAQEPLSKRAIPATIGISGLAAAAALLFLVPLPEVRQPEPASEQPTSGQTVPSPGASPVPPGASPPPTSPSPIASPASPSPVASPEAEVSPQAIAPPVTEASPSPEATASPAAETSPTPEAASSPSPDLTNLLATAPEITDPEQIDRLTSQLRSKLDAEWDNDPDFDEELVYRVGVGADGDILGFRYANDAAVDNVNQTPLLDLRYTPTQSGQPEPIAEFRVVFTPGGVIQVSPWHGRPRQ